MPTTIRNLMFMTIFSSVQFDHLSCQPLDYRNFTVTYNRMMATNLTDHIQNLTHRFLIRNQMLFCSKFDQCSIPTYLVPLENCCSPCSCDSNCIHSGTCCLDKILADDNMEVPAKIGYSCVLPQLIPKAKNIINANQAYRMINKCRSEYNYLDIINKCHVGHQPPQEPEMTLYLPVTSVNTNQTYRNKYCGLCNLEEDSDLKYWNTKIVCEVDNIIFPENPRQLLSFILNHKEKCNVVYLPPLQEYPQSCIRTTYNECNVTGLWEVYDSRTDWACRNYENPFRPDEEGYKNVFCFMCNSDKPNPTDCYREFGPEDPGSNTFRLKSFAALFNFVQETSETQDPDPNQFCSSVDFRYDTYHNTCREITCLSPFVFKDGVCKNIFDTVALQKYEIFLKFNKTLKYYDTCNICPTLSRQLIQDYVKLQLRNLDMLQDTCSITVLYTDDPCSEYIRELQLDYLDYVIVHIEFYLYKFHDPMFLAETLLNQLTLHLPDWESKLCVDFHPKVIGGTFYTMESGLNLWDYIFSGGRTYIDPLNGQTLQTFVDWEVDGCKFKPTVSRLVKFFICPHVNISVSENNISRENGGLCLKHPPICIPSDEYTYADNDTRILICMDTYFQFSNSFSAPSSQTDFVKTLVSFVCSCFSIISLIFTLVTYSVFPVLRTLPGLYTMALCATLIIAHALFTFGAGAANTGFGCEIIGLIIHLTMLASVLLMNVCSFHMFRVFRHLDRQHILTEEDKRKQFVIGLVYSYVVSGLLVAGHVTYSYVTKGESGYGNDVCFINNPNSLLFTFTMPVILIVLVNVILFCIVIWNISRLPDMSASSSCRHSRKRFLMYVKLSTLTGMAWLVGFIGEISRVDFVVYLFIILLAGQGIFVMFSFVINKRVYNLYRSAVKRNTSRTSQNTQINEIALEDTNIKIPVVKSREFYVGTTHRKCLDGVDEAYDAKRKCGNDVKTETGYSTKL